jgi:hypothetical protein
MFNFTAPVTVTATTPAELTFTMEQASAFASAAGKALEAGGSFFGLVGEALEDAMFEALNVADKAERRLDNITGADRAEAAEALLAALEEAVGPAPAVDMSVNISAEEWAAMEASLLADLRDALGEA